MKYRISDQIDPDKVRNRYSIGGGICIKYNEVILTRSSLSDCGYIGYRVFNEIEDLIDSIPKLTIGVKSVIRVEEESFGISLDPKDDQILFSIVSTEDDETVDEFSKEQNRILISSYPCGEKTCVIPSKLFFNTAVRMGYEFISDATHRFRNLDHKDVDGFRMTLKITNSILDEYNRTH